MEDIFKQRTNRIAIIGLGNTLLSDDGIGIKVGELVFAKVCGLYPVEFIEAAVAGLRFLDVISGYRKAIIIDAVLPRGGKAGTIYRMTIEDFPISHRLRQAHDVDIRSTITMGKQLGYPIPVDIVIYGIEVIDPYTIKEELSVELQNELESIAEIIIAEQFSL